MQSTISFLKSLRGRTLLLTHKNADADAVASCAALQAYLKSLGLEVEIGTSESIAKYAHKLAEGLNILIDPDCAEFENVIAVETSTPQLLSGVKNLRADAIIDHHSPGPLAEKAKHILIEQEAKSASQIIYKILKEDGFPISRENALRLAAGIVADTAHLRIAGVEEFKILVELLETGIKYEDVLNSLETPPDVSEAVACLKAARRMELYKIGDLVVAFSNLVSFEAPACRSMIKLGADLAVVAAKKENEIRISSRGKNKLLKYGIDLSKVFKKVGQLIGGSGGGHDLAGSANGRNRDAWDAAKKLILKEVRAKVGSDWKKLE